MIKDDFNTLDYCYKADIHDSDAVKALNSLPDVERNLFILYIECSNHYSEVARRTNLSVQTIKEQIDGIKDKLKDILNEQDF